MPVRDFRKLRVGGGDEGGQENLRNIVIPKEMGFV